jgi:hypothetical protein
MSFFSQSGHWYTVTDGTIASAHDLDLRSARLVNAFPSITTVLKERANGALDTWKQDQLFQAMVAHPYKGDNLEQYKRFISELASKKGTDAADFGTRLHDALDIYPQMTLDPDLAPYVEAFAPSYDAIVLERVSSEIMLADSDVGIAGRTDLVAVTKDHGLSIIDYKTSKFRNGKAAFWDSYKIQLAFYAKCYQKQFNLKKPPRIINCGINSEEPMAPQWKVYTEEEQEQAYKEFMCIAYLWFSTKKYWPMSDKVWPEERKKYNAAREEKAADKPVKKTTKKKG